MLVKPIHRFPQQVDFVFFACWHACLCPSDEKLAELTLLIWQPASRKDSLSNSSGFEFTEGNVQKRIMSLQNVNRAVSLLLKLSYLPQNAIILIPTEC